MAFGFVRSYGYSGHNTSVLGITSILAHGCKFCPSHIKGGGKDSQTINSIILNNPYYFGLVATFIKYTQYEIGMPSLIGRQPRLPRFPPQIIKFPQTSSFHLHSSLHDTAPTITRTPACHPVSPKARAGEKRRAYFDELNAHAFTQLWNVAGTARPVRERVMGNDITVMLMTSRCIMTMGEVMTG